MQQPTKNMITVTSLLADIALTPLIEWIRVLAELPKRCRNDGGRINGRCEIVLIAAGKKSRNLSRPACGPAGSSSIVLP